MIKEILRKAKISTIAIITAVFCMTVPQLLNVGAAIEGGTDIRLHIQTKEIDIDDVPDNGIVDLDITIDNNPTIDCLSLVFEKDSRVQFNQYDLFDHTYGGISNSGYSIIESNSNAIYSDVIFGVYPDDENGVFVKIKIKLPDKNEIKKDDFFPVRFLNSCDWAVPSVGVLTPEIKILNGSEYFGGFENGGIRIIDDKPAQPAQNVQEQKSEPDQPSAPIEQNPNNGSSGQPNNNNNVQQPATSITTPTAYTSQTVPLTSSITFAKATKATTVSTSVSTAYMDTEFTDKIQTDITDDQASVSDKSNGKYKIIICLSIAVIILIAIIYLLYRYRKKDNT